MAKITWDSRDPKDQSMQDFIDDVDKLTQVSVSLDVAKMREEGKTRRPEDYSDEAFTKMVESHMFDSNADVIKYTREAYACSGGETRTVGIRVQRKGQSFQYTYFGVYAYMGLFFSGWKRIKASYYYTFRSDARQTLQRLIRELIWKTSPNFM